MLRTVVPDLANPWIWVAVISIPVIGKIVLAAIALRGSDPKDRPNIIKALAELYRWWGRRGGQ